MKKFSTIALALTLPLAVSLPVWAQEDATKAPASLSSKCNFLPDAPDKHVVVKGDTLWGISGKFLQNPWCWPEVWGMNKEEIHNPHWIYPNQIVYFDRANGRLRLGIPIESGVSASGLTKMAPQTRSQTAGGGNAITSIPNSVIEPYLSQPLIIDKDELAFAPRIVAAPESRVYLGKGDKVYTRGNLKGGTSFQVFRPGVALKDPETKEVLGYEAVFLGTLKLERTAKTPDGVDTFMVVSSKEEMGVGDLMVAIPPTPIINYVPHRPEQETRGRVIGIYGGVNYAGQNQIVSINRGSSKGVDVGSVLELGRFGKVIADKTDDKKPIRLPDEVYGRLFVFRVFKNISYGLVMEVTDSVSVGDLAQSPEK